MKVNIFKVKQGRVRLPPITPIHPIQKLEGNKIIPKSPRRRYFIRRPIAWYTVIMDLIKAFDKILAVKLKHNCKVLWKILQDLTHSLNDKLYALDVNVNGIPKYVAHL